MRIRGVRVSSDHVRLSRPWGVDVPGVHVLVAEVDADNGLTGVGFSWTPRVGASAIRALLDDEIVPYIVGQPTEPRPMWDSLWRNLHEGGSGGITTMAMAAVDIALWDLNAKAAGRSLVDLIGRQRSRVPVYGSGVNFHYTVEELREQAQRWVAAGYRAVKIKVGHPLAEDLERVAAVREVIGPERLLMVDANQRWDLPTALRAVESLTRFDLHWVEEPLLADDLEAHAELRRQIDVPVAIGENLYTVHQFRRALSLGACDLVQPNLVRVGGITPFLRIVETATELDAPVYPHLLVDLSGQLALTLPGTTEVEDVEDASFAALGLLHTPYPVRVIDGELMMPSPVPGHGLRFAVERLDETPTPVERPSPETDVRVR